MRKQFTFITILILICGSMSFGQTATLGTATKSPGETVQIPLTVGGWTNVNAITLNIRWKKDVLTFTGITGGLLSGAFVSHDDSTMFLTWTNPSMSTFNGVLFNLNFVYNGVVSTPLQFLPSCSVTSGSPPLPLAVTWTDGSVLAKTNNAQTATLGNPTGMTGGFVTVPLMYAGFGAYGSNVGSITQKIHFDASKLSFVNISATGNLTGAIAFASNGVLTISWTNTAGKNIDFPANQLNINFIYNGNTTAYVNFYSGCLITTNLGVNIPVSYFSGSVSPGAAAGTAVLGNVTGALQGQDYMVPLNLTFPTGISSLTLNIIYDSPRLSYIGIANAMQPGSTLVNTHGDTISIVYTNLASPSINGLFLNLKFKYNGVGVANVMFGPGCLFTDNLMATVQTAYTNATITPANLAATATIGSASAAAGNTVLVPITFASLPTNMGAVTMDIMFDQNKLSFIDLQNNTFGANVGSPMAGKLVITWASSTYPGGNNINGLFLNLRFLYIGGGATSITFTDGCEAANILTSIVPLTWNNGGVNIGFNVSGMLAYNSAPNADIPLTAVTVYLKASPTGPILMTTTTDGSGNFSFSQVPNGTYALDASTSKAWGGVNGVDVTRIFQYESTGGATQLPFQNALRIQACDANLSGTVNGIDVTLVFQRESTLIKPVAYTAPDWFFGDINAVPPTPILPSAILPVVTVSGADVVKNFWGLCSGDVNGSYSPIP